MKSATKWMLGTFAVLGSVAQAQTYLPPIADGANWTTAVVLMNTVTAAATVTISFHQDILGGATAPWNPPFLEIGPTSAGNYAITLPAGATFQMHPAGTSASLTQGWAQVSGPSAVVAYAIYTALGSGARPNQDGTSQAVAGASRILMPFDATAGFSTGIAIVNPQAATETISVNVQTDDGVVTKPSFPVLQANGQLAFDAVSQFPVTSGHRGIIEFYTTTGTISVAALRFNPMAAFTSLPVVLASGSPVLGAGGSGGTGSLPQFTIIQITPIASPLLPPSTPRPTGSVTINGSGGAYTYATTNLSPDGVHELNCTFGSVSVSGTTLALSMAEGCEGFQMGVGSVPSLDAAMTVTLSPASGQPNHGNASITTSFDGINSASGLVVSYSGTVSGTYTAN